MLQRRLLARTSQVELTVDPALSVIEITPNFRSYIDTWIAEERDRRMNARHVQEPQQEAASNQAFLSAAFLAATMGRDSRSFEQYKAEVESYLAKANHVLAERGVWSLAHHPPARLSMKVQNRSEHNYTQVAITLAIESPLVLGYRGEALELIEGGKPRLPKPPDPWGTPPSYNISLASQLMPRIAFDSKVLTPQLAAMNRGWRTNYFNNTLVVEFDPCDLRPHAIVRLPEVPIAVKAEPGKIIPVEWTATATNADGVVRGKFAITASESTLSADRWA